MSQQRKKSEKQRAPLSLRRNSTPGGMQSMAGPSGMQGMAGPSGMQSTPGPSGVHGAPGPHMQGPYGWAGQWMPWGPPPGMQQWMGASQSATSQPGRHSEEVPKKCKPWEEDSEDSESDDEDFKAKRSKGSTKKPLRRCAATASQQMSLAKVKKLPSKFMGKPAFPPSGDNGKVCVSCGIYRGEVLFVPCGHARFCTKCVNKVHDLASVKKRLQRCPAKDCLSNIEGWVRMFDISP